MPLGYEYKRYFIILQEEDKGYEMTAGKIPTGYVKIEIKKDKVKIRGFIQNTISDTKSKYKLNLLAPKKKLLQDIGLFRMDNNGRGEFYGEFDSDNVNNSGIPISEFTGAIVVAESGVPLAGYLGRERIPWREWYKKEEKTRKVETKMEDESLNLEKVAEAEETRKEKTAEAEENRKNDNEEIKEAKINEADELKEDSVKARDEEYAKKEEEEEKREEDKEEPMKEEREEMDVWQEEFERQSDIFEQESRDKEQEEEFVDMEIRAEPVPLYYEEPDNIERYSFHEMDMEDLVNEDEPIVRHGFERKKGKSKVQRKLSGAINNMEKYDGFHRDDNIEWYRIGRELPLLNEVIIPVNGAMMPLSYPYISETNGINIGNCLLGVESKDDKIRYVYIGIPAIYNEACRLCYEYRGFTEYKRVKNMRKGYWVMCIDIIRGKVCSI